MDAGKTENIRYDWSNTNYFRKINTKHNSVSSSSVQKIKEQGSDMIYLYNLINLTKFL